MNTAEQLHFLFSPRPVSMKSWRTVQPKPLLFDLIHTWNLSYEKQQELKFYKLQSVSAIDLAKALDHGRGTIWFNVPSVEVGKDSLPTAFIPIYTNISRATIKGDARSAYMHKYWLSFRSTKSNQHIVLIQKAFE